METVTFLAMPFAPCQTDPALKVFCSGIPFLSYAPPILLIATFAGTILAYRDHKRSVGLVFFLGLSAVLLSSCALYLASASWVETPAAVYLFATALLCAMKSVSRVARRVVLRALPVAILFGLVAWGVMLELAPILADEDTYDFRIVQALIAGGVVAFGWIVTFSIQQLRTEQAREKKEQEMMVALAFEIIDTLQSDFMDWDAFGRNWQKIINSAEPPKINDPPGTPDTSFFPFFPSVKEKAVFDALTPDIHLLPRHSLPLVITYYSQVADVIKITEDLKDAVTRTLPNSRRARLYLTAYEMRREMFRDGLNALKAINEDLPDSLQIDFSKTAARVNNVLDKAQDHELRAKIEEEKEKLTA